MRELFANHQVWALLIAGVLWLVQILNKKGTSSRPGRPAAAADDAEAERTRRVQEDVRRKIAERRAGRLPPPVAPSPYEGPVAPPVVAPRPVAQPESWIERKWAEAQAQAAEAERPSPSLETAEEAAVLARQRQLEGQARALAEAARAAPARSPAPAPAAPASSPAEAWLSELRQPQSVRRAILLREILGPPVCFR